MTFSGFSLAVDLIILALLAISVYGMWKDTD